MAIEPTAAARNGGDTPVAGRSRYVPAADAGDLRAAERVLRYRWTASLVAGRRVLDAGCGDGTGARVLSDAGAATVVGVDREHRVVSVAAASGGARFEVGDVRALAYENASFDVVVCFDVLERVAQPLTVLDELRRVLAPGGVVLVSLSQTTDLRRAEALTRADLHAELSARFAHVAFARQEQWLTSAIGPEPGPTPATLMAGPPEEDERAAAHVVAVAADVPVDLPAALALPGALTEWDQWRLLVERTRAENDALRDRVSGLQAAADERDRLRRALLDAEQLLAGRLEVEADLADAETELRDVHEYMRRLESELEQARAG